MKNDLKFRKFDFRNDLPDLFDIMMDSRDQALFHGRVQINSLPDFEKWMIGNMSHFYHDFYVVTAENDYKIVGYVYSYEYRVYDGHCKVCVFLNREYRGMGVGALCGIRFLDELFSAYPLRKVYAEIFDYNKQSLESNLGFGFVEEGCLKDYRYLNGSYHDMHLLAITREKFYEKAGAIVGKNGEKYGL